MQHIISTQTHNLPGNCINGKAYPTTDIVKTHLESEHSPYHNFSDNTVNEETDSITYIVQWH